MGQGAFFNVMCISAFYVGYSTDILLTNYSITIIHLQLTLFYVIVFTSYHVLIGSILSSARGRSVGGAVHDV